MCEAVRTRIGVWHWGKLVIVWAWGGLLAAILLAAFLSREVKVSPLSSVLCLAGTTVILAALTTITWIWLTAKESRRTDVIPEF